jgi:hypothetical protein
MKAIAPDELEKISQWHYAVEGLDSKQEATDPDDLYMVEGKLRACGFHYD